MDLKGGTPMLDSVTATIDHAAMSIVSCAERDEFGAIAGRVGRFTAPIVPSALAAENAVIRSFLADNLTADGYTLRVVEDRASALSALESEPPDLVICDVNGETLGLLDAVRNADGLASRIDPETPLIVLTARAD